MHSCRRTRSALFKSQYIDLWFPGNQATFRYRRLLDGSVITPFQCRCLYIPFGKCAVTDAFFRRAPGLAVNSTRLSQRSLLGYQEKGTHKLILMLVVHLVIVT